MGSGGGTSAGRGGADVNSSRSCSSGCDLDASVSGSSVGCVSSFFSSSSFCVSVSCLASVSRPDGAGLGEPLARSCRTDADASGEADMMGNKRNDCCRQLTN